MGEDTYWADHNHASLPSQFSIGSHAAASFLVRRAPFSVQPIVPLPFYLILLMRVKSPLDSQPAPTARLGIRWVIKSCSHLAEYNVTMKRCHGSQSTVQ